MQTKKKNKQLGMDAGTAQSQLKQIILWSLLQETGRTTCFVCNEEMSLETFSIEHMIPWLDKENAIELFFDLKNISFSLYYNHIIDDSLTLWSYKWVICFLYFRIPYFCRNPLLFI